MSDCKRCGGHEFPMFPIAMRETVNKAPWLGDETYLCGGCYQDWITSPEAAPAPLALIDVIPFHVRYFAGFGAWLSKPRAYMN